MTDHITALAGTLAKLGRTGGTALVNGLTVGAPVSGIVQVDLGAGRMVPATVPGSFRANIKDAQAIKLLKNQTNNTYVVDSVLTALTIPTVTAPPANASTSGIAPGANNTGSSGCYNWDDGGSQLGDYAQDIAENTRFLAGDINELRDDVGWNADDLASLKATVNSLVATVNSLKTTVAAMRDALIAQGHVV